jgi:ABC-type bacteriocin/lantibiotic exporter with double-glycine peptidase domain
VYAVSSYRLIPSIVRIVNGAQEIKYCYPTAIPYLNSIEVLRNIENHEKKHVYKKIKFNNSFTLKDVRFNYDKSDNFILEDANLEIRKGKFIGIYGESGSGKTTLINILLGLYRPNKGKVLIDEFDISKDIKNCQSLTSYIPQNVYIIDDTILKNVAFGEETKNIDILRVNDCLKKSNIYEFVYNLKDNVHSIFGEFGEKLSGGQRQRLAIARALYKDTQILVFDEFTNFLDKTNEIKIIEEIKNMKNKTRIMITHNEKALDYCDEVYELKNKKLFLKAKK